MGIDTERAQHQRGADGAPLDRYRQTQETVGNVRGLAPVRTDGTKGVLTCIAERYTFSDIIIDPRTRLTTPSTSLMVRLDAVSKDHIARAAKLRYVSISDYVRTVVVAQAQRELSAAEQRVIALTPDEQLAFWQALNEPAQLSDAQQALGALMRGA